MTPTPSDDKMYRVAEATDADLMRCEPDMPKRAAAAPTVPKVAWQELQREQALERVLLHGESLLILGVAGTGRRRY